MGRAAGDTPYYQFDLFDKSTGKHDASRSIEFISVTSVIGATLAKGFLVPWAAKYTIGAVTEAFALMGDDEMHDTLADPDKLLAFMDENKLGMAHYVAERSDEGTEAHAFLERLCLEAAIAPERADKLALAESKGEGFNKAVSKWWIKNKPQPVASEEFMVSMKYRVAGTADLAWINQAGQLTITDLKTRKPGAYSYESDHVQVAAYGLMWDETHVPQHRARSVLIVRPDGTFSEKSVTMDPEVFINLLAVYNGLKGKG